MPYHILVQNLHCHKYVKGRTQFFVTKLKKYLSSFFFPEDALLRKLAIMSGSQASRAWMGGLPGVQVRLQLPNMDSSWWPAK